MQRSLILVLALLLLGCTDYSSTVAPPAATVLTPYGPWTATIPASIPPVTVTGTTGLPPGIKRTGLTLAGTPTWNTWGDWDVNVTGTVANPGFFKTEDWSGSGIFTVMKPTMPAFGAFSVPGFAQTGPAMTLTVTPPGVYTIQYSFDQQPPGNMFSLHLPTPLTTGPGGTVTLTPVVQTDLPATANVTFVMKSVAPSGDNRPIELVVPFTKN